VSAAVDQALELLRVGVAELDPDVHDGARARQLTEKFGTGKTMRALGASTCADPST